MSEVFLCNELYWLDLICNERCRGFPSLGDFLGCSQLGVNQFVQLCRLLVLFVSLDPLIISTIIMRLCLLQFFNVAMMIFLI